MDEPPSQKVIVGFLFDSKSRFLSSFSAKQVCYISRYEIDETPRHNSRTSSSSPTQPLKMLELKIGTKHIYAGKHMVNPHVQNAQYCLAMVLVYVEFENQIGILEPEPHNQNPRTGTPSQRHRNPRAGTLEPEPYNQNPRARTL